MPSWAEVEAFYYSVRNIIYLCPSTLFKSQKMMPQQTSKHYSVPSTPSPEQSVSSSVFHCLTSRDFLQLACHCSIFLLLISDYLTLRSSWWLRPKSITGWGFKIWHKGGSFICTHIGSEWYWPAFPPIKEKSVVQVGSPSCASLSFLT